MKTVKQFLHAQPNRRPVLMAANASVIDALKLMADHNIGSVAVTEEGKLLGLFSERDFVRNVALKRLDPTTTRIGAVLADKMFYVTPDYKLDEVMALMTEKRVRQLPVLDAQQNLVGIISIGDIVKDIISEQAFEIEQLERYITG